MNCLCPVCNQEAEFPPEAVGKWTRCAEGCRAIGTRFRVVAGGVGELEAPAVQYTGEVVDAILRILKSAD